MDQQTNPAPQPTNQTPAPAQTSAPAETTGGDTLSTASAIPTQATTSQPTRSGVSYPASPQGVTSAAYPPHPQAAANPFCPAQGPTGSPLPTPTATNQPADYKQRSTLQTLAAKWSNRDTLTLVCALMLALIWNNWVHIDSLVINLFDAPLYDVPLFKRSGFGFTVFVFGFTTCIVALTKKNLILKRDTLIVLASLVLMALAQTLYQNPYLLLLNSIMVAITCAFAFLLISGFAETLEDATMSSLLAIGLVIAAPFARFPLPFYALTRAKKTKTPSHIRLLSVLAVVIGLICGIVALSIIVPLLISADSLFSQFISQAIAFLESLNFFNVISQVIRGALVGLLFFSIVFFTTHHEGLIQRETVLTHLKNKRIKIQQSIDAEGADTTEQTSAKKALSVPQRLMFVRLGVTVFLGVVNIIYVLFVLVQFFYLFGVVEPTFVAEYARSGFFELVTVAALNLIIAAVCIRLTYPLYERYPENNPLSYHAASTSFKTPLKVFTLGTLLLTCVILVSSISRMTLYISEFGFTFLRALTILGMIYIGVCLVGMAIKIVRVSFPARRVMTCALVLLWAAFALSNVNGHIANYNVDQYLQGNLKELDADYLEELAPESDPALDRLAEERPEFIKSYKKYPIE